MQRNAAHNLVDLPIFVMAVDGHLPSQVKHCHCKGTNRSIPKQIMVYLIMLVDFLCEMLDLLGDIVRCKMSDLTFARFMKIKIYHGILFCQLMF